MNDVASVIEHEPGPSWARANWPVAELDEVNLGLDPTQASIEAVQKAASKQAAAAGADPGLLAAEARLTLILFVVGAGAGLVYWLVAGRGAGFSRRPAQAGDG